VGEGEGGSGTGARRLSRERIRRLREEHLPPRAELLEQAARASRTGLRTRSDRLVETARPILHTSLAAAMAYFIATELVGHDQAFFAPIAAVITLGLAVGERGRRAIELGAGVAVGIAIADGLVALIGTGPWQVAAVTALAMLAATLLGGGPLLASEAGVSAVLVATIERPGEGWGLERFSDALIGSGTALLVAALLLPFDPAALVRAGAEPLLERLAGALDDIAAALDARDLNAAERALVAANDVQWEHDRLTGYLAAAGETARLSIRRRSAKRRLGDYAVATAETGLALANVRVLARGAIRAITLGDATPPDVVAALRHLARAVRELGPSLERDGDESLVREPAVRAAALANAVIGQTGNMSALHIVGQVRLIATDLLKATGLSHAEAAAAVREAAVG
jgi:uncharacterized membrane protein YgaE (UPF0421/DUF939 family)